MRFGGSHTSCAVEAHVQPPPFLKLCHKSSWASLVTATLVRGNNSDNRSIIDDFESHRQCGASMLFYVSALALWMASTARTVRSGMISLSSLSGPREQPEILGKRGSSSLLLVSLLCGTPSLYFVFEVASKDLKSS